MSNILTLGDAAQRSYKRGNNAFYAGDIPKERYIISSVPFPQMGRM